MLDLFFFEKVVESSNIKCLKMFSYELFTRNVWGRSMTCGENMGLFNRQLFQVKVTTTDKKKDSCSSTADFDKYSFVYVNESMGGIELIYGQV